MPHIADEAILINVDIEQWSVAAQRQRNFHLQGKVSVNKRRDRHIGDNVAIINDDAVFIDNQVFDIFNAAGSIEKYRFMAECNRDVLPASFREYLLIFIGAVMSIDNKAFHPN